MSDRHRNIASSTHGVASYDGSTNHMGLANFSHHHDGDQTSSHHGHLSNSTSTRTDMDDESMYVNAAKTEMGSTGTRTSNPPNSDMNSTATNGHGHQNTGIHSTILNSISNKGGPRFRGLSRSAFNLLSQDDQTLSELLTVEVGESSKASSPVAVNAASQVQVDLPQHPHQASVSIPQVAESKNVASLTDNTKNERYLHRIRDLERQVQMKDEQLAQHDLKWEHKFQGQSTLLEERCEQIHNLEGQISALTNKNGKNEKELTPFNDSTEANVHKHNDVDEDLVNSRVSSLTADQVARYSRQLLLNDGWGVQGQHKLLSSSVLVIGAGGIGSTLLLYLASSGVGNITVVDFDNVDMSNLHRQVIHSNDGVGMNKAISACEAMKRLNPTINCTAVTEMLTFDNAMELVAKHDCVVDACDNPQTRYLVNDACILNKKPLVSGSAMGTEGQLTVHGYKDSACYRCLYPRVNPAEGGKSCSDNGVLGPVPGLIGILQAIETLKLLTGAGTTMHDRLLMYDSLRCSFLSIKKGKKRSNCAICGPLATISNISDSKNASSSARGPQQCGMPPDSGIPKEMDISCKDYHQIRRNNTPHILLDVRVPQQYELCTLKGSINIPLATLESQIEHLETLTDKGSNAIYCLCRRGIASAAATKLLSSRNLSANVYNIRGGLNSWVTDVDPSFPMY